MTSGHRAVLDGSAFLLGKRSVEAQCLRFYQRCLLPHRLPDPPANHCHQNPRHQRPKDQQHQKYHQGRHRSALGECLCLIGHIAPAGNQGHWLGRGEGLPGNPGGGEKHKGSVRRPEGHKSPTAPHSPECPPAGLPRGTELLATALTSVPWGLPPDSAAHPVVPAPPVPP